MLDPNMDPEIGFAAAYDIIYAGPAAFYTAQMAFLLARLGTPPGLLLDAGCGTGRHTLALAQQGYHVVGLDASRAMLQVAAGRLAAMEEHACLLRADLRAIPCVPGFSGVLCLESPLAYILDDQHLLYALAEFTRLLEVGGRLVLDVFDYAATLGPEGLPPHTTRFPVAGGNVAVRESHRCDVDAGVWHMRQEFTLDRRALDRQTPDRRVPDGQMPDVQARRVRFAVDHTFALRTGDDYAAALEAAGLIIEESWTHYPGSPVDVDHEQRIIFVARRPADRNAARR